MKKLKVQNVKLCNKCKKNLEEEQHTCPYQKNMFNNVTTCNCCLDCQKDCVMSV